CFAAACANLLKDLRRKVQAGRGSGYAASGFGPGIDCLVALAVLFAVFARNVRRQGHVAQFLDHGKEIGHGVETECSLTKFASGDNLRSKFTFFAERNPLADVDLPAGTHQRLPLQWRQLPREQYFYFALQKILGGRVSRAERLSMQP